MLKIPRIVKVTGTVTSGVVAIVAGLVQIFGVNAIEFFAKKNANDTTQVVENVLPEKQKKDTTIVIQQVVLQQSEVTNAPVRLAPAETEIQPNTSFSPVEQVKQVVETPTVETEHIPSQQQPSATETTKQEDLDSKRKKYEERMREQRAKFEEQYNNN